jgi:hypothetical protein
VCQVKALAKDASTETSTGWGEALAYVEPCGLAIVRQRYCSPVSAQLSTGETLQCSLSRRTEVPFLSVWLPMDGSKRRIPQAFRNLRTVSESSQAKRKPRF